LSIKKEDNNIKAKFLKNALPTFLPKVLYLDLYKSY